MRTALLLLLITFVSVNANAANIYIRDDGGTPTECDGSVDKPKNSTKKCAFNSYYKELTFSATSQNAIIITKGSFAINVSPPPVWIPVSTFVASPLQYINAVKSGRKVFFKDFGGLAYELQLRKY